VKSSSFNFCFFRFYALPLGIFAFLFLFVFTACRTESKTDMRTLAPAETLIYLEANDIEKTLSALTESRAFRELAKEKSDFSFLSGTQIAVAVTGFEASEKPLTDEHSVINFKPRFVAVADTHSLERTNLSFAENQLNEFAQGIYDDAKMEKSEKHGAQLFTWTAGEDRRLFAAVSENLIYFGNDEPALEKALAVRRGEAESIAANENLAREREKAADSLAFGFVTAEGAAQIGNFVSLAAAKNSSEDDAAQSFIARVLPAILQKTVREVSWIARKNERGIEDAFFIKTAPEVAEIFRETLKAGSEGDFQKAEFLPPTVYGFTRYNLQNPQVAWRSVLLTAAKQTDTVSGEILLQFSGAIFAPYGVSDAEGFLSAAGGEIVTAKFDEDGEKTVVIADVKDAEKLKKTIAGEINFNSPPEKSGNAEIWKSGDKTLAAAFIENKLILGETESVLECLRAKEGSNLRQNEMLRFAGVQPAAFSFSKDSETVAKIVEILGEPKAEKQNYDGFYTTETVFSNGGFERKTVSDFGIIGAILENLEESK
jgi:hypothetical protein